MTVPLSVEGYGSVGAYNPSAGAGGLLTTNWPAANRAIMVPIVVPWRCRVRQFAVFNGSVVAATNNDVGLLSKDLTLIKASGATAMAGASVIQYFNVTDFDIEAGRYYLAGSLNTGTGRVRGYAPNFGVSMGRALGVLEMASAHPLPAVLTGGVLTANFIPHFAMLVDRLDNFTGPQAPGASIQPYSLESSQGIFASASGGSWLSVTTSATWPAANRALYFPFTLETQEDFAEWWILNGTAVSGTFDVAVYSSSGNIIAASHPGSLTTQTGTSTIQTVTQAFTLGPGHYYKGLLFDNTTATVHRLNAVTALNLEWSGVLQQAVGAATLPSTMTGVAPASAYVPSFGLHTKAA